jgi:hypothetical protein
VFDNGVFKGYFNDVKAWNRNNLLGLLYLAKQLGDEIWALELKERLLKTL